MKNWAKFFLLAMVTACSGKADSDGLEETGDTGDVSYPSTYESGNYRMVRFSLLPTEEGLDVTGDEVIDNKLPAILPIVDALTSDDMSADGLNASIEEGLTTEGLILLVSAAYTDGLLTYDLLLGLLDADTGALSIDTRSYDDAGDPQARFTGAFEDETRIEVEAKEVQIPITFDAGATVLEIPFAIARMEGNLAETSEGILGGVIPVDGLIEQVIDPLIPTGDDYDPANYNGMSREEFMVSIENLANLDSVSDVPLEDGRGISAAFSYEAEGAEF